MDVRVQQTIQTSPTGALSPSLSATEDSGVPPGLVIGASIGGAILVAGIIGVVVHVRRKRARQNVVVEMYRLECGAGSISTPRISSSTIFPATNTADGPPDYSTDHPPYPVGNSTSDPSLSKSPTKSSAWN